MKVEDVYLVGVHPDAFRSGEPSKVVAVKMVTPYEKRQRLCYEVRFDDGVPDYVPVSEVEANNYEMFTLKEMLLKYMNINK